MVQSPRVCALLVQSCALLCLLSDLIMSLVLLCSVRFKVKGSVLTVDYSAQPESQQIFEKAISAAMTLLHTARARKL